MKRSSLMILALVAAMALLVPSTVRGGTDYCPEPGQQDTIVGYDAGYLVVADRKNTYVVVEGSCFLLLDYGAG